ncbi:MAG: hypothetical protein HDS11_06305 [Bacteroides sp.]|nr:hypothetical protein [Bacteroides sp.]
MTDNAISSATAALPASSTGASSGTPKEAKVRLTAPRSTWMWAIGFLLSLSLTGLSLYPALLFTVFILLNRFVNDRTDFLVMLTILVTSPGFISRDVLPLNFIDPLLALSCIGMLVYRKNVMVKKVTIATFGYVIFLLVMSTFSDETFSIQILTMRRYMSILVFILPLWVYANRRFDINELYRKVLVYTLIISAFYVLDGFIFKGWILLPGTFSQYETPSTFWDLHWAPTVMKFPRKYPSGIYIIILAAYPLARNYKLRWWQWALIVGAFAAMRTMTVIAAFVLTYVTFQGRFKQFAKYFALATVGITILYFVDSSTGGYMRIESTVQQFAALNESQDSEELSEFGSTRMAQIIPKFEALAEQNCLLQGFGFIHPTKTTLPRYQIHNDLYSDISLADENAAYVEVTQFNTILHTGIIGLIVQTFFYVYLYFIIRRRTDHAGFYLSTIMMASIMGIGGFGGLTQDDSLPYVALALGACLLDARPGMGPRKANASAQAENPK